MSQINALISKVQKHSAKYFSSVWRKRCRSTVTVTKEKAKRLCPQVGCELLGEAGGLVLYLSEKDYVCSYCVPTCVVLGYWMSFVPVTSG